MTNTDLIKLVESDIHAFMNGNQKLFFNECDFQMCLALWLMKSHNGYDDVYLEYYVPYKTLEGYIWENELRLDLVVRKGDEYLPIELKYKHKKPENKTLLRFGEDINANGGETFEIMKSQHLHGRGLYGFWKDVRRLEIIRNRYDHVVGGLVVFLTNDDFYMKPQESDKNYYNFEMQEGKHSCNKHWQRKTSITKKRPDFYLNNEYSISWNEITTDGVDMHYCIVTVGGKTQKKQ